MVGMKGFRHFFSMPPLDSSALKVSGIGVQEPMRPCIIDRPTGTGDHLFMQFHNDVWIVAGDAPVCQPAGYGYAGGLFGHTTRC
jgi:hypothetical protein